MSTCKSSWQLGAIAALLAGFLAILALAPAPASAALPSRFTQFPAEIAVGSGANQLWVPRAVAIDQSTGHLYVAEYQNNRISEFDAWGVFIEAFGWGVEDGSSELQACGPAEPEVSPPPSLCQRGKAGAGPGQMNGPDGVALDSAGNLYVLEGENARVQKFSSDGDFVLMFGGEVNKTTKANVCTAVSGDTCGVGVEGTGTGFFQPRPFFFTGNTMAVGPDGTVYVGDKDRIQAFNPDGTFNHQLPLPTNGWPSALAFDSVSNALYFAYSNLLTTQLNRQIFKLAPTTGEVLDTLDLGAGVVGEFDSLTTDSSGTLYASFDPAGFKSAESEPRVVVFDADGDPEIGLEEEFAAPSPEEWASGAIALLGLATNEAGDLYVAHNGGSPHVSFIAAYGPPPFKYGPPPKVPPTIAEQYAVTADTDGATLRAKVNPHYWNDTRYYVEYGTSPCFEGGCQSRPAPPGALVSGETVNATIVGPAIFLAGLQPDTTYHYRFVAESSGGGPVLGLSGKADAAAEGTFTTMPLPKAHAPCPANEAFHAAAAFLPDCRAYEMVSPVDKEGADVSTLFSILGDLAGYDQGDPSGERLTYSAYRAFGDAPSAPYASQYLARRGGSGWTTTSISPPREGPSLLPTAGLDFQYKGFSADLCRGWLLQDSDLSLAKGSVGGFANLYRRDLCAGGYEALAPLKAPSVEEVVQFKPEVQGFSTDGLKAFFVAAGKLTNNATTDTQLYEAEEGGTLRLVCILPSKAAFKGACSAGAFGSGAPHQDRSATLSNAISVDGSRIYWTASNAGPGPLYVRVDRAETIQVSSSSAHFWTASADGSKAIYSVDDELFEFDLASEESTSIAKGFKGFLGAGEDAAGVYFASGEDLGEGAVAGRPNLYRYEAGSIEFIATLADMDVSNTHDTPSSADAWPIRHLARATPDGQSLAFMSAASLTGRDNTDVASGQPDAQVFLYRAAEDELLCVSCNPTGARPAGRDVQEELQLPDPFWVAGQIPTAQNQLHFPRVLSDDGNRLFFESFDPLSLRDTNGKQDVYQWEAQGAGNCTEAAPGFDDSWAGCVNLISSGESPEGSEIVDASADGRDVFFKTAESLLLQDPGQVDIYDARAGGGLPASTPPAAQCEGEACQRPLGAPNDRTPSSASFQGPGNQAGGARPRARCGKGKVRKRGRCVKPRKRAAARHKRHVRT